MITVDANLLSKAIEKMSMPRDFQSLVRSELYSQCMEKASLANFDFQLIFSRVILAALGEAGFVEMLGKR